MGITAKLTTERRLALGSVFLVANALVWYFTAANALQTAISTPSQAALIWSLHFSSLFISLVLGGFIYKKISQTNLFLIWTTLGIVSPLLLFTVSSAGLTGLGLVAVLFGVSIGLGMPGSMAYFTDLTEIKNRGHYGGLIMLLSGVFGVFLSILSAGALELTVAILVIWRIFGLSFLFMPKSVQLPSVKARAISYFSVIKEKSFLLYLVPWLMFSLVGYLSVPVQKTILTPESYSSLVLIENIIGGAFALISGLLIDKFGRKRIAIIGFVLVGIEFSILGLYPQRMESWLIYTVLDGIVWGTFFVLFIMSLWGDLSQKNSAAKYYAIGILPFFISKYFSLVYAKNVAEAVPVNALFSFTAFFLFLAVLPTSYAPETLPEKIMKDRELKNYVAKAQKLVEKEQAKEEPEDKEAEVSKKAEPVQENSDDYEKAKQLAEKYY